VCAGCGRRGRAICDECARSQTHAHAAAPPLYVDDWCAVYAYEGVARELVARIKYRNARAILPWFAQALASRAHERWSTTIVDCVTWPPTTRERKRRRGFDHAQLLAREVARQLHVPVLELLTRSTNDAQTGRAYAARRAGPAFDARNTRDARAFAYTTVMLVDDVATTGATLREAAAALRRGGVRQVLAGTVARTPPPGSGMHPHAYTAPR
jgi:ComF family protein